MGPVVRLISIITPVRNGAPFLPELVASLQAQTYRHWECLLIDNGSSDGSVELAQQLVAEDPRFRCFQLSPRAKTVGSGPGAPRNLGLDHLRGELVCFLDVDDVWHPRKLERQLAFHQRHHLQFSVTAYGRSHLDRPRQFIRRCPPPLLSYRRLVRNNCIPMLTVMLESNLLVDESSQDPLRFRDGGHEDYLLWLQLLRRWPALRYGCLPDVLGLHRRHGSNFTALRWRMPIWLFRVYRQDGHSAPVASALALRCTLHQLLRVAQESLRLDSQHLSEEWASLTTH